MTDERFMPHTRTAVSIADPANRIDFYATFLRDNRRLALPIQQYLAQHWSREQRAEASVFLRGIVCGNLREICRFDRHADSKQSSPSLFPSFA